jgi:hypothetical protein
VGKKQTHSILLSWFRKEEEKNIASLIARD